MDSDYFSSPGSYRMPSTAATERNNPFLGRRKPQSISYHENYNTPRRNENYDACRNDNYGSGYITPKGYVNTPHEELRPDQIYALADDPRLKNLSNPPLINIEVPSAPITKMPSIKKEKFTSTNVNQSNENIFIWCVIVLFAVILCLNLYFTYKAQKDIKKCLKLIKEIYEKSK